MVTIHLEGQLEARLKQAAAATGEEPAAMARQVLAEHLPAPASPKTPAEQMAGIEAFIAGMTAWVAANVPEGQFADDDREWQYEDRGE